MFAWFKPVDRSTLIKKNVPTKDECCGKYSILHPTKHFMASVIRPSKTIFTCLAQFVSTSYNKSNCV